MTTRFRAATCAALLLTQVGLSLSAFAATAPTATLATSGQYRLTQGMVNDDLTVWQMVAGRPLAPADRQTVASADVDTFHDAPAWFTQNIAKIHKALPRLERADSVVKAEIRQENIVDVFCTPEKLHISSEDADRLREMIGRYVPVIGTDQASNTVITGPDIAAWAAATRFMAQQSHVPPPNSLIGQLAQISKDPSTMGPKVSSDAANMERNWAALQLVWPHLTAAQRAASLNPKVASVKRAGESRVQSQLAVTALAITQEQFGNYPYALDPRLMAYKTMMDRRMQRFDINMMEYNLKMQQRGMHDFARSMNGQGPDPQDIYNPIPIPTP